MGLLTHLQCGIAATVAVGVSGLLLNVQELTGLSRACGWMALGFVAAIALGLASTAFVLLATCVRTRRMCVNERFIFHGAELRATEAPAPSGAHAAVTRYRRFTTNHLWQPDGVLFGVAELALTFVVIAHGWAA